MGFQFLSVIKAFSTHWAFMILFIGYSFILRTFCPCFIAQFSATMFPIVTERGVIRVCCPFNFNVSDNGCTTNRVENNWFIISFVVFTLSIRPKISLLPFRSGAKFEPLSNPLQAGIRFLSHPLPSKELWVRYLPPTPSSTS